ncbi:hypothetical protein H5P28_01510 [Ruficoccus amylovorans]|uniref:Cellobiose phosphorylase n=1 Tax=Ruficoccus amylovorans TaxID=1804625 RepID=A0A842HBC2_9BACT|nr:hypothetical protein [Ruficoccus amylovorans]MBC2592927.1 hypothetical protein [Ruficoccus amylovorans]
MSKEKISRPRSASKSACAPATTSPNDTFVTIDGTRFQCIEHVEQMPPFFFSVISPENHWMFAASNGALSAGRGSPDTSLFPYYTVDKIIDNWNTTGPQTIIVADGCRWEPFKPYSRLQYPVNQRLLKSIDGDIIIFEETNGDLQLRFSYSWQTSPKYGFVRQVKLENTGPVSRKLAVVDGLCNFMPAGLDARTQLHYSCLGDAYKLSELDTERKLLIHRMASSLTDEAVPMECLLATAVWSHGWDGSEVLLRHEDADAFLSAPSKHKVVESVRAMRGCYLNAGHFSLKAKGTKAWVQVADIRQTQQQVAELQLHLKNPEKIWQDVLTDIDRGHSRLQALVASSDAQQLSAEEAVTAHHHANVLFNIMRGGVFEDNYTVSRELLTRHIETHHTRLTETEKAWLAHLPETLSFPELVARSREEVGGPLARLCQQYLPLTFSRRHGDPSRPWNNFAIQTRDANGQPVVGFQGNWRDIFQNWESLAWSFPRYNDAFLAQFLNASTADGYNPYRLTSSGIEWEKPDPEDPWASIGYWGDHQIIYLLKFLEFSFDLDSESLRNRLGNADYVFADVPYEIKPFEQLERDPNHSIHFNAERDRQISERTRTEGSDGRLLHDSAGRLVTASLLEKLLIPLAVKLSNLVPGGGIWMNTQRPEWNDANNALAGYGLSMVTTAYLHRYVGFLEKLLKPVQGEFDCHENFHQFLEHLDAFFQSTPAVDKKPNPKRTYASIRALGKAGEAYRSSVYRGESGTRTQLEVSQILAFLGRARAHLFACIRGNQRNDGLYHSYNVLHIEPSHQTANIERLGLMLEGQVAVLSSGAISPAEAVRILDLLAESPLYCPHRQSYILYTDRELPRFLETNRVKPDDARAIPLLKAMIDARDNTLLISSPKEKCLRFHPAMVNRFALEKRLDEIDRDPERKELLINSREAVLALYEATFNHRSFTGRSGSMFAYEGLGSIYWHMVSKLMLAAAELSLQASRINDSASFAALRHQYYTIQNGLGFRKTPQEYGAFPADAYSHTPAHAGAQQPGLTGMVKEGILCRFAELGVSYRKGEVVFRPRLLRREEFLSQPRSVDIIDTAGLSTHYTVPVGGLLFTLAQVPVIYHLDESPDTRMEVYLADGSSRTIPSDTLPQDLAEELIGRTGRIKRIEISFAM